LGRRPFSRSPAAGGGRRSTTTAVVLLLLTFVACGKQEETPVAPKAQDIILITIDTLRADSTGFGGSTRVKTPFLDSLAAKGTVFANAHAHNVVTLPSHTNILTGLLPYQHGIRDNAGFELDPKHETVATMLKRAGYTTGAFVGAFPLDARFGLDQGFDVYDDNYGKGQAAFDFSVQERRADAVLQAATSWWRANEGKKRFLWVHVYDPHAPYAPPEPFAAEYRDAPYLGEIAYVDRQLGDAFGALTGDALIVVTGDHGEALGDHGEITHGLFTYEATLKVPLLVSGGGTAHGVWREAVRHVDIVPTILEAAGVPLPQTLAGTQLFRGGDRDTYFESLSANLNRGWAPLTGVIRGGVKYIDLPLVELYDLPSDPAEQKNVADDRRRDVDAARRFLAPLRASLAPAPRTISAEAMARLRSLGYVSGTSAAKTEYTAADDPKNLIHLDTKLHEVITRFQHKQPEQALQLAREVVNERPDMAFGREMLALMLRQNGRLNDAIAELEKLVARPEATDDNRVQLALLLSETGRAERATHLLEPFSDSDNPDLLNAYGVALADAGKPQDAMRQWQRVLALDENNAPAYQNLGIVALRANDMRTARAQLSRALQLNPRLPLALNTLGVISARENDLRSAVAYWNQAIALDPQQFDALYNSGLVLTQAGRYAEARKALEQFVRTAPSPKYDKERITARRALAFIQSRSAAAEPALP
ncbi:MAG TPA: tetratricopeptide repeat protein, partial [Thermoanaerobaculia bacterium]|nr:tetratricopeptide repeat protein [Thermoanaerobaculia bacterium]